MVGHLAAPGAARICQRRRSGLVKGGRFEDAPVALRSALMFPGKVLNVLQTTVGLPVSIPPSAW